MITEKHRENLRLSHLGQKSWNKGQKSSLETRKKISLSLTGLCGKKSRRWKGEKAGYHAKHSYINKYHGKAYKCDNKNCIYPRYGDKKRLILKVKTFQWANISNKYKSDWIQLCASCHRLWDNGKIIINGIIK